MALSRLAALPRRATVGLLAWVSDNPLRVSGAAMAVAAAARLADLLAAALGAAGIGAAGGGSGLMLALASDPAAVAVAAAVATGRPAYVLAVVVGVAVFVGWR